MAHGRRLAKQQVFVKPHRFDVNLSEVATVIRRESPDVIALQEADGPSFWSGDFDHVERLADLTGYGHCFRGEHKCLRIGSKRTASGTAILSRHPLHEAVSHRFPRVLTGRKGFVVATVQLPGSHGHVVDVVSVHLDFLRKRVRRRQILAMARELASRTNPLIILGDMNCWWARRNDALSLLVERLGVHPCRPEAVDLATFPSRKPLRRLDWVLLSPHLEFGHYEILTDRVSDHLAVLAEVRLVPAA